MAFNRNTYQGKHFLTIEDLPNSIFFINKFSIPGMTIGSATQSTRMGQVSFPGDTIVYNPCNISIFLDEDFECLKEIKSWINSNCPSDSNDYNFKTSDMILNILTNSNKENLQIQLKNCYIEQINDITLDTTTSDDTEPKIIDILVRYQNWDFI